MAYCGNNEFVDDVVIVNNMCDNGQGDHTIVMSVHQSVYKYSYIVIYTICHIMLHFHMIIAYVALWCEVIVSLVLC